VEEWHQRERVRSNASQVHQHTCAEATRRQPKLGPDGERLQLPAQSDGAATAPAAGSNGDGGDLQKARWSSLLGQLEGQGREAEGLEVTPKRLTAARGGASSSFFWCCCLPH
jgi:hypothetical protein